MYSCSVVVSGAPCKQAFALEQLGVIFPLILFHSTQLKDGEC